MWSELLSGGKLLRMPEDYPPLRTTAWIIAMLWWLHVATTWKPQAHHGPSWPIPRWVVTFSFFLHHDCHLHSKEESWSNIKHVWLVVSTPLKNISQWEGLSHILWKIKNVWNHHPDVLSNQLTVLTFLSQSYEYLSSALEGTTERLCWERLHLWRPWWLPSSLSLVVLITLDSKINPIPKYRNALSKLNPTHFTRFYPLACTVKPSDCLANMERPGVKMQ
jgi:hypothetical protein